MHTHMHGRPENMMPPALNPFKPVVSNGYTSKHSAPYWSNSPFGAQD